jgi:RNA polymerase sigma factor (sigma-70 family)
MKKTVASSKQGVTGAQMREAERGLKLMLGPKFPKVWIAEHSREVLGQAHVEYQEWLEKNPPAHNPVGWLLTCAYRRALNLRDSEKRRPLAAPLDTVFHLADESTPTPEQEALDRDRQKRLREALSHLPEKEVKLLALVYFEDNSIREAGRRLGWQKSAADRHHNTAMKKLRALVGDDRSLLSPATLGLAAYLASKGRLSRMLVRVGQMARSLSPFSETGAAAANSGVGRAVGVCGAGVVALVCVGAASVVVPGLSSAPARHLPAKSRPVKSLTRPSGAPTLVPATTTELPTPESAEKAKPSRLKAAQARHAEQKQAQAAHAPRATPKKVEENFGLDSSSGSTSEPAPAPEAAPESSASSPSSSPAAPSQPSGSSATREFGL